MFSNLGYRAKRQFIILLVPFTIAGILLLYGYYKLLPEPTCSDLIKNQNEEEVDCGGPCTNCLFKHLQDIYVFSVNFDEVIPGVYDVAIKIKNPNTKLLAKEFFYEIALKDDKGVVMQKRTGRSYLYAGETAYIIEGGIPSKRKVSLAEFSINNTNVSWILGETKRPVFLSGENISEISKGTTQLKLKIFNQALTDFKNIEVGIVVTDDNGEITAINKTLVDSIGSGGFAPLIFIWPGEFNINAANVLIEPRVNLISN